VFLQQKFAKIKNKNKIQKESEMTKKMVMILALLVGLVSGLNADIYDTQCYVNQNRIFYNHNGFVTHAWVFVNQKYKGDFWTISSGSGSYSIPLKTGDQIIIYYYSDYEYGHNIAYCQ